MIELTAEQWHKSPAKHVLLFGMSGLGKTFISNILRENCDWFHYSVDYRIGTRYMGEHIVDNFKCEAMRNPFLAGLLRSNSIYIASNITFENLSPLSTYMGKPGNPALGGIAFAEYRRRQEQHRKAEVAALLDSEYFIDRARQIYGYENFVCDSGGSICEVVNPYNQNDPVMQALAQNLLPVWIRGRAEHTDELVARFDKAPKPMYFGEQFLTDTWNIFCRDNKVAEDEVNPDGFMRFAYRQCLDHRLPRYQAMAENWGITVEAEDIAKVRSADDFNRLIAGALDRT
ncbi:MAG: ATPase [Rhodobacteraceae bacterium]|nr:ATPase [Paracoccaceae bacterium]